MIARLGWALADVAGMILGALLERLVEALRWLLARPSRMLILGLILIGLLQHVALHRAKDLAASRKDQVAAWHGKFRDQKAEMLKLVDLVRAARIEAARRDEANIARVQREWDANLSEVKHGYTADLADARAALAEWMRQGGGARPAGAAGRVADACLSPVPALSAGALRPGDTATLDGAEAEAVTVNTVRLEHLIDAWGRAASIDPNAQP